MTSSRRRGILACAVVIVTVLSSLSVPAVAAAGGKAQLTMAVRRCPRPSYGAHRYAPGRVKTVALTFDDGPGRSTAAIVKILALPGSRDLLQHRRAGGGPARDGPQRG